ncbi:ABC transporter ATP-binding protein [Streptomyces avermitilis]|uniref:ABC transporter ATP-binding protein n=2 Tax=Streptomyces avermitilis TaxID=33903 RepID=Q82G32_STRAW|nr:ABC transporter ATP-binding protein [Streptomyces avermitilis]MYS99655.1 ATP-binding cassette domain-containing protein [Streptomyces sp. SID5469]KUN50216.1 ABC transporter ATP-binding protein [Streptomyces avermitilis]OOV32106.1 ABC transporter ATP-binding protein [Streptomyces avermitilis]BAC71778.1 putative ABC transporter ATP-binding protein [Streptomyces avermitilis MA-4680 = NBRC 14893]BBJ52034.1 ABC transporter ATP-binding protein [Streptomyces avermitilis]
MSSTRTTADVALEAYRLGKRYGRRPSAALDDCSFRLPAGRVSALVGPNGAGKSTLLALAAGLLRPTSGTLTVLGGAPGEARDRVAYLSQDKPLHPQLTIAETLRLGAELNPGRWDAAHAASLVEQGSLDPATKIRRLSGGQRTRVALALALGKRPDLMLLDEPMADLDPLARHEMMGTLMADAAERGTTVLMSSHIVAELTDACDHLLLLGDGRIRLGGGIDDLLTAHSLVTGRGTPADLAPHTVVESRASGRGLTALIRRDGPVDSGWEVQEPSLEELLLAHLRAPGAPALITPGTAVSVEVTA